MWNLLLENHVHKQGTFQAPMRKIIFENLYSSRKQINHNYSLDPTKIKVT